MEISSLDDFSDPVGRHKDEVIVSRSLSYCSKLVPQIAFFYGCDLVFFKTKSQFRFILYGRKSCTVTCSLMIPYILKEVRKQAKQMHEQNKQRAPRLGEQRPDTITKCLTAVANAMTLRLLIINAENLAKNDHGQGAGENALVPIDEIQAMIKDDFPGAIDNQRAFSEVSSEALAAAKKISLYNQAENNSKTPKITFDKKV